MPDDSTILLAHGGGGVLMKKLVDEVIVAALGRPESGVLDDSALIDLPAGTRAAFTTDSYVVKPIFFRGGDIGRLAVCGTVNDLAMVGAQPLWLSLAFVVEEGLPMADLRRVVESVRQAADDAHVRIVTGDTKVVERGSADRLFVNTSGVGAVPKGVSISAANARPGDRVIISGALGDHGVAVMSEREGIAFETPVLSDVAPLAGLVQAMLSVAPAAVHALRDPTRGGASAALNEIAAASNVGLVLRETELPVRPAVRAACDMMGFDVLSVANEGKLIAIVDAAHADDVLAAMHEHEHGTDAAIVGEATTKSPGMVTLETELGGSRIVDVPYGEQLPRIC